MSERAPFRPGKSLLAQALSPSSRNMLEEYFTDAGGQRSSQTLSNNNYDEDEEGEAAQDADRDETNRKRAHSGSARSSYSEIDSHAVLSPLASIPQSRNQSIRPQRMLSTAVFTSALNLEQGNSRTFVQVECKQRPFCLQLSINARDEIIVAGFTKDPHDASGKGAVERSGLIRAGDVLVAVNDEMDSISGSVDAAAKIMMQAELPALLTFRRVPVVKSTLGEYSIPDIARNLELSDTRLAQIHGVEAASIVKAWIDMSDDHKSMTPLSHYVQRIEQFLHPPSLPHDAIQRRSEELRIWMDRIHQYADRYHKDQLKKWTAGKVSNYKRIEMIAKQRDSIRKRLEKMQSSPDLLHPENHIVWQEYIELRHLASQLSHSVEQAKRDHFLPSFENYALRFGSDGVYVGLGDLWIASFVAKFSVETRSRAPHVLFTLSTPSSRGLQLRCTNVKLATEGRLPSFQCDELNIDAQLVAEVPFVFDAVNGWSVPQDELHVKLQSFSYYERRHGSAKRGADHDTVIKLFINRLLPSVVRQAAQSFFCVELGPLFEKRDAHVMLSGELRIQGRPVELYDAPLNSSKSGATISFQDLELSEEARTLTGLSMEDADALCTLFKRVETSAKKRGTVASEHGNLSLRVVAHYLAPFQQLPHIKPLLLELWIQSFQLLASSDLTTSTDESPASAFFRNVEQLQQYPVDVTMTLSEVTLRLDLCEAAATYYTTLQRLLRHRLNSVAVGLSNLEAMKDGSFLENELTALDEWYDRINRVLSYVTTNVDDLGVVMRGGIPAGFRSHVQVEANDLSCKGPCTGSFTIPLTDLATLQQRQPRSSGSGDALTGLFHERNALVFSKFFTDMADDEAETEVSNRDRVSVSVKRTTARVIVELPRDMSSLKPGGKLVPFQLELSCSGDEPPCIKVETGEYAKCQYKAKQIKVAGSMWRLLQRSSKAAATATKEADAPANASTKQQPESTAESVWTDYLDSPFFNLKFHFLTSCQVTRDHIFWSLKSASLSHPNVARIRHRLSIVELLQDIGMASLIDSRGGADGGGAAAARLARRRQDANFRRALFHKLGRGNQPDDASTVNEGNRLSSVLSAHETLYSPTGSFASSVQDDDDDEIDEEFERVSKRDASAELSPPAATGDNNEATDAMPTTSRARPTLPKKAEDKQTSVFF